MQNTNTSEAYCSQLTVMFCDLVGSTALSERLAPCTYFKVLKAYQKLCTLIVQDHQGYIAQPLGDGLLIYFGYPFVKQDDATRAVKSGVEILIAMQELEKEINLTLKLNLKLAVRVGIATGNVVMGQVGTGNKSEWLAIGVIPNIAARLQSLAASNSVVFGGTTYQLVSEYFDCLSLGKKSIKGISKMMEVYQLSQHDKRMSRNLQELPKQEYVLSGIHHKAWSRKEATTFKNRTYFNHALAH